MSGFNFRTYLRNYEILQVIGKYKTRIVLDSNYFL